VGIVDGNVRYVIACFLPLPEESAMPKLRILSSRIYDLMLGLKASGGN
jgi:hypothetical protein